MHGKFFWYDIMTTDAVAARRFYGDVMGWGAQYSRVPGSDYAAISLVAIKRQASV